MTDEERRDGDRTYYWGISKVCPKRSFRDSGEHHFREKKAEVRGAGSILDNLGTIQNLIHQSLRSNDEGQS